MIKIKYIILLFFLFIVFFLGCYTSFTHPPITDAQWGAVRTSDDCTECHANHQFAAPVLPQAAQDDYNWQFYSGSAWWQDEYTVGGGVAVQPDNRTGPRTMSSTPMTPAPVAMPVQGGTQSLGKKSASSESEKKDENKRSIKRRTNTTKSSDTSEKKAASRSRRE